MRTIGVSIPIFVFVLVSTFGVGEVEISLWTVTGIAISGTLHPRLQGQEPATQPATPMLARYVTCSESACEIGDSSPRRLRGATDRGDSPPGGVLAGTGAVLLLIAYGAYPSFY